MKAETLRVGNKILFDNKIIDCLSSDISTIYNYQISKKYQKLYKPIKLTKEICLKIKGFKKSNWSKEITFYNEKLDLETIEFNEKEKYCWLCFEGTICGKKMYFLHELQNLIIDLTGKFNYGTKKTNRHTSSHQKII